MRDLIETHIAQASTKPPAALVAEAAKPEPAPIQAVKPPQLASADSAQVSVIPPRANEAPAPIVPGSNAPITPVKVKTVTVKLVPPKNAVTNIATASVMPTPIAKPEATHATAFAAPTPDEALAETLAAAAPIETTAPSASPPPSARSGVVAKLAAGKTVAVLGPNGAGKSSLLNVVAGLVRPDRGRASLENRVLFDIGRPGRAEVVGSRPTGAECRCWPRTPLLFPHLSAVDNVAFGPRSRGRLAPEVAPNCPTNGWQRGGCCGVCATADPPSSREDRRNESPVARALASDPRSPSPRRALGRPRRGRRPRLSHHVLQRRCFKADQAAVIVTHDVFDAFTLADRVVVLEAGRVVDAGPTSCSSAPAHPSPRAWPRSISSPARSARRGS